MAFAVKISAHKLSVCPLYPPLPLAGEEWSRSALHKSENAGCRKAAGESGYNMKKSKSGNDNIFNEFNYAAVPLNSQGAVAGVVRGRTLMTITGGNNHAKF